MADNTENIGGVSVSITGDYSQLAGDFDAAVALAVSKGATLAEAIQSAMAVPDTAPLTQAFGVVGDSAVTAAGQLKLFDEAAHVNYSDAAGQLNLFATELEAMGPTAAQAATGIMQIPQALGEVGDKAHETEGIVREFGEKVSEILEHPVQQFRALVEAIGPVGIAMTTFGAIVYEVGKNIAELVLEEGQAARNTENFAEKLGLSFEEAKKLSEMAQVVSVDLGSLTRVATLLAQALEDPDGSPKARKTADALKEMGIAAETGGQGLLALLQHLAGISDATERLAEAAKIIPARTVANLQPLLANFDELSKAIEALGGQLDESMVKNLLEANKESKLLGIAWDHVKEAMAATFAPTVTDGLKLLTQLMTGAPSGTLEDQIKRVTAEINSLTGSALAGTVAVSGMMGGGFTALGAGGDPAQLEALQKQLDDLRFRRIKEQMPPETGTPGTTTPPDLSAANYAAYGQLGVTNYSSLTHGTADDSGLITKFSDLQAFDALATSLTGPRLAQAADNLEAKLQAAFHAGAISADEFQSAVDRVEQKLNEARDSGQLYGETIRKAFEVPTGFTGLDGAITTVSTKLDVAQAHLARFTQLNQELTTGLDGTSLALLKATTGIDSFDVGLSTAASEAGALGGLMLATSMEMPKFYAPLIKARKEFTDSEIIEGQALLKAQHIRQSESLEETLATNAAIQESDRYSALVKLESQHKTNLALLADAEFANKELEDNLATEIKLAQIRGVDATRWIEQLTDIQIHTKALADASANVGDVYRRLETDFSRAFDVVSKGIADNIVDAKDWGKAFDNVIKTIEKEILNTLIGGAFKALRTEILGQTQLLQDLGKGITGVYGLVTGQGLAGFGGLFGLGKVATTAGYAAGATNVPLPPGATTGPTIDPQLSQFDSDLKLMTAAMTAQSVALAANTAALVTSVVAQHASEVANLALGNVVQATFAPAALKEVVTSSFGPLTEDMAAAVAPEVAALGADTAATVADTGATVADTGAEIADTAATAIDATATAADTVATVADTAAEAADAIAETANTAAVIADTAVTATAAATSATSSALGAVGSAIGAVGGFLGGGGGQVIGLGVQIANDIVQGAILAHISNLLGEIEVTTRGMLNVLAVNGEDSILGATIHTWQELVTMSGQLSNLHDDNIEMMGKLDNLVALAAYGGGGGGGGGGGLSAADIFGITDAVAGLRIAGASLAALTQAAGGGNQTFVNIGQQVQAFQQIAVSADGATTAVTQFASSTTKATAQVTQSAQEYADSIGATLASSATIAKQQAALVTNTTASLAQSAIITAQIANDLASAHAKLDAGNENLITSQESFALGLESAIATKPGEGMLSGQALADAQNKVQSMANTTYWPIVTATGLPNPSNLQVGSNATLTASTSMDWWDPTNQVASTGGSQFSGFTDPNVNPAIQYLINQGYKGMGPITGEEASYLRNQLHYADPTEGWQKYFQEWVPDLQALTPAGRDQMNSGFHFGPSNTATPTPANLIPGTPVNSFNSGGAMVTVNALNPSSRGVVDGIITGLRQIGVKV